MSASSMDPQTAVPSDFSGRRFGVYQLVTLLGAGGMGEVYRARDTKLNREVAIKLLRPEVANDRNRLDRFEREAQLLAALNHPNIAHIHGFEDSTGVPALVMELVEGPTLADRIAAGAIPVDEALAIAKQIAQALEAAHAKGIVHRDLKPANIKITPQGVVKVLDFGLARAVSAETPTMDSLLPTVVATSVDAGLVAGTPNYMSPEQARGQPVDKRTDIWALGCVIYEMLTGRLAFSGQTVTDILAAIVSRDPAWSALPVATPHAIRRLLERCLEKDLNNRLHDVADARIDLEAPQSKKSGAAVAPRLSRDGRLLWMAGAAIVIGLIAAGVSIGRGRSQSVLTTADAPLRASFRQLTSRSGIEWFPSLAPDGRWVAYAGDERGNRDIYLQSVTGQTAINLTADSMESDDQPAFSPDGERIAFRSNREGGGIFVMGRTGESVRRVTHSGFKPTWSPDGSLLAYTTENVELNPQNTQGQSELWIVNVASGEAKRLSAGDAVLASWSPHGQRIAHTRRLGDGRQRDIWTTSSTTGDSAPVTNDAANDWGPVWSPDGRHLYFTSDRSGSMNLWRIAIDEQTGQRQGEPESVTTPAPFLAHVTISGDGSRVAYSSVLQTRNIQKLALDPKLGTPIGEPTWVTSGSRLWANPDPSHDGRLVAFYSSAPNENLYVARTDGGGVRQVTSEASVIDRVPRWSPDSTWIAYFSNRSGTYQVWKIRPDGSEPRQLTEAADDVRYPTWSPDGSRLAVTVIGKTPEDGLVYIFDPNSSWKDQMPQVLPSLKDPRTLFVVNSWSADGAFLVGQAGNNTQGIVTYSLRSGLFQRLTDFGEFPVWFPDSQRVLFVSGGKDFYVVDTRSRKTQKVFSVERDIIGPPQLSRDGSEAFFSRRVTESDLWLATFETSAGNVAR